MHAIDQLAADAGYLDPADLDQLDTKNAIDAHAQALDEQQEWAMPADGTLVSVDATTSRRDTRGGRNGADDSLRRCPISPR